MADNLNLTTTVEAWADIVIKNWRQKIVELDIHNTGALYESFVSDVVLNAGNNPERVDFAYEYYGTFVDMGVGSGVYVGNPGNVDTTRKAKPWKSKVLYQQAIRLSEILLEKFNIIGGSIILENIRSADRRAAKQRAATGDAMNRRGFSDMFQHQKTQLSQLDIAWMKKNGLYHD